MLAAGENLPFVLQHRGLGSPEGSARRARGDGFVRWADRCLPMDSEAAETARHEERGHGRTYRIEDRSTWQWQARGGLERLRSTRPSDAI